jgi:Tfp pilus assembly protein PilP
MRAIIFLVAALTIALMIGGCGGNEPAVPEQGKVAKKAPAPKKQPAPAATNPNKGVKKAVKEASSINVTKSKEVLEKVGITYSYDPVNKPDPFKSFSGDFVVDGSSSENPLLKYEVRYFRLVGITMEEEPIALFEDPNGRAYVLGIGSRIGRGGGVIQTISKSEVIVTETRISTRSDVGAETVQIPIQLHPEQNRD